jgi:predicted ATPase
VTDPGVVPATIGQSLGARGELREYLAGRSALLLLDNLEQVLDAAPLIADLLGSLPELRVIATSRERLAVSFEQEYPVPPLDEAAAEELFVSRARQLEPDFGPDEAVGEICRRLDRLPLALELASTRIKLMSTSQMLTRLERRLDLLGKGMRDRPDRQATMRATIGWSYDLLSEQEQALFRRLGVFAGSFELEAAEAVCNADLDDLQSLIDKSLLRHQQQDRFFLLELTREYALEQLNAAGETDQLRRRHADWFLKLVRAADRHLKSEDQRRWFSRLDADTTTSAPPWPGAQSGTRRASASSPRCSGSPGRSMAGSGNWFPGWKVCSLSPRASTLGRARSVCGRSAKRWASSANPTRRAGRWRRASRCFAS